MYIYSKFTSSARYHIRLMFEWGGGCLWYGNDAAREQFDVGPIEDDLPLSTQTRQQLNELSEWHDQSLNWDYPPNPGPWTAEDAARFEEAAHALLRVLQAELGAAFHITYTSL